MEKKYLATAQRTAEYGYSNIHEAFAYIGGTPDNPNVIDKEAGLIALDAFLAIYDVSGDKRWLDAAVRAADFAETWMYGWAVPIPEGGPATSFPRGRQSIGLSIIATGHSGADLFMAGAPFLYYRLYVYTGDAHYADVARLALYNTRRFVDVNGSMGYAHPGLCTEALSLAPPRGQGVNAWLPWLTVSMIEPLARLEETFGSMDIRIPDPAELEKLRAHNKLFARTRGLFTSPR